jgi:hypothetical protein
LKSAERIVRLAGEPSPATVALCAIGGAADLRWAQLGRRIGAELIQWEASLAPAPALAGRPRLIQLPLSDAAAWYRAALPALEAAAAYLEHHPVSLSLDQCRRLTDRVAEFRSRRSQFADQTGDCQALLGSLYRGVDSDDAVIRAALEWASSIRGCADFQCAAADVLLMEQPDPEVARSYDLWCEAADGLAALFPAERADEIRSVLRGPRGGARRLVDDLMSDGVGPDEWRSYRAGMQRLEAAGLGAFERRAAAAGVVGSNFSEAVERALLSAWLEKQLASDSRLTPIRAVERDQLVAEFRRLDERLVHLAYAEVIETCSARRPRPNIGQTAVLEREANKKKGHMPVRTLLDRTSVVAQLLKPCFMMSPLTVSRFMPASYRFDVVIFDEASQVMPHDAVNCVYRGSALVVAGDQKQMPPTDFFGGIEDSDDEFAEEEPDRYNGLIPRVSRRPGNFSGSRCIR